MRTIKLCLGMLLAVTLLPVEAYAQCANGVCKMPVRNAVQAVVQAQPVRSVVQAVAQAQPVRTTVRVVAQGTCGILQKIAPSRAQSCSGTSLVNQTIYSVPMSVQSSCSGSRATSCSGTIQSSCAGNTVISSTPTPQPVACSIQESYQYIESVQQVSVATPHYVSTSSGDEAYQRAYASAAYRAQNGIKGHVSGELAPGRASSSGVGFATNNSNPMTCLGVPGRTNATCAVVRGSDGWYSTCVR